MMIPYGRQCIDDRDVEAVSEALRSDFLTTGPLVSRFEDAVADEVGAEHAVAVSSGTAALHCAMHAIGIHDGDAVIIPAITFVATAHAVRYCGGVPICCDVEEDTLLMDPDDVRRKIGLARDAGFNVRAIIAVDYAGQPCDYDSLRALAADEGIIMVADAAHSLGASYKAIKVGSLASMTCFSFHPLKAITTAEGGMVTTNNPAYASSVREFRNLGRDSASEVVLVGHNYRLSDIQCALGLSQLSRLHDHINARRAIADRYESEAEISGRSVRCGPSRTHSRHLYVIRVNGRNKLKEVLLSRGIGTQVHYTPVHQLLSYRRMLFSFGLEVGCPVAEKAAQEVLSLPIYPGLKDNELDYVIDSVKELI